MRKAKKARSAEEGRVRRQRLDYQPSAKPIPITSPTPTKSPQHQQYATPILDIDVTENCQDLGQSLAAIVMKYSLDSFTIATSDGLVFASSIDTMAQEDAARYSGKFAGKMPGGVVLFSLNHKGSELTGIMRTKEGMRWETQNRIKNDTKAILNKWI
ncbi:MAG TPA: hypothetical protein P5013_03445 [Methanoregula sp.]|nr:hypothetical protein [Methanoregula sp.]